MLEIRWLTASDLRGFLHIQRTSYRLLVLWRRQNIVLHHQFQHQIAPLASALGITHRVVIRRPFNHANQQCQLINP
ncbi:Uncharacterised protein [Vibrio cholerae]|nr:Uncharacterised protein [Vibrio cholerae]